MVSLSHNNMDFMGSLDIVQIACGPAWTQIEDRLEVGVVNVWSDRLITTLKPVCTVRRGECLSGRNICLWNCGKNWFLLLPVVIHFTAETDWRKSSHPSFFPPNFPHTFTALIILNQHTHTHTHTHMLTCREASCPASVVRSCDQQRLLRDIKHNIIHKLM